MLMTNWKHLETDGETQNILKENENVMICCGRMGPMCIPVYKIMDESSIDNNITKSEVWNWLQ